MRVAASCHFRTMKPERQAGFGRIVIHSHPTAAAAENWRGTVTGCGDDSLMVLCARLSRSSIGFLEIDPISDVISTEVSLWYMLYRPLED